MKTVYMIYVRLPNDVYKNIAWVLPTDNDYVHYGDYYLGLYAWTTKKEYADRFLNERKECNFYILKVKTVDDSVINELKDTKSYDKLSEYSFDTGDYNDLQSIKMIVTKNEYDQIVDDPSIYYFTDITNIHQLSEYYWFNDELIAALDLMGYTTEHDINGSDPDYWTEEEQSEMMEYASNNLSYLLTVRGNSYYGFCENKFALLLFIFRDLFLGERGVNEE